MTKNIKDKEVNILIVDDELSIRETIKVLLEQEKYKVSAVGNGTDAISKIKEILPDLILTDLKLPDMNGLEVLHVAKKIDPDVCTIIMTAYADTETAIKAVEQDVYDYITKPLSMERIKLIIEKGLERRKLALKNKELLEYLQKEKNNLESILEIGEKMSSILNLEELLNFIITKTMDVIEARRGSLMLLDKDDSNLKIVAAKGLKRSIITNTRIKLGEGIVGWVAKTGEPLLVLDVDRQTTVRKVKREKSNRYKSKSFLSMPLKKEKDVIGVINITDKIDASKDVIFTVDDLRLLSIIVNQAVISIENAKLYKEINLLAITSTMARHNMQLASKAPKL